MAINSAVFYIAHSPAVVNVAGTVYTIRVGDRIKGDHPALVQCPQAFVLEASGLTKQELDAAHQRGASAAD